MTLGSGRATMASVSRRAGVAILAAIVWTAVTRSPPDVWLVCIFSPQQPTAPLLTETLILGNVANASRLVSVHQITPTERARKTNSNVMTTAVFVVNCGAIRTSTVQGARTSSAVVSCVDILLQITPCIVVGMYMDCM